jgi:hypothetical protein
MLMTPAEIERLEATAAQVRIEQRRIELTALIERFREHVERVGASPGFERELAKAEAELHEIEQGS